MNNDKTKLTDDADEFVLNFDDDVVDLTSPGRNSYTSDNYDTYNSGSYNSNSYNSSNYNSGSYNSNSYDNANVDSYAGNAYDASGYTNTSYSDPYGAYDPNRDLSLGNSAASIAYANSQKESSLTFKLVISAMIAIILYMLFITYSKTSITSYILILGAIDLFTYAAFLADSFVLKTKTGSNSPIIIAILLSIIYPVISFSKRGKTKLIPIIWIMIYVGLVITFARDTMPKMLADLQNSETVSGSSKDKVELLKSFRVSVSSNDTVDDVIKNYVQNPVWNGTANSDGTYNITVTGNSEVVDDGEIDIKPVTIVFKLKKGLTSFSTTTFTIGDTTYTGSDAQYMWVTLTVQ